MSDDAWVQLQKDCERVYQGINDPDVFARLDTASVLITGGSGFLGSWICQYLYYLKTKLNLKLKVYIVARDKQKFDSRLGNVRQFDLEFIRCDIRHLSEIPKDVNYIIHAAGDPDSRRHMTNPLETMGTIAEGTMAVLRAADRVSNLRTIVHLSSGSIYGTQPPNVEAIGETHPLASLPLDSLKSGYTEAKRYSEVLCTSARSELRLPLIVLRPFTFLGPFQSLDAPWAINNFINDGLKGRPIRVLGDGKTVRGFLYGADAAGWIVKLMLAGKLDQIYNIGSATGYTLLEIAEKVAENFHPRPEIILNAALVPSNAQSRYLADIQKLSRDHNLAPYTDLDLAVKRTIDWYRSDN